MADRTSANFYGPYKIVLLGGAESGKSAFLQRHVQGDFEDKYQPTNGMNAETVKFSSNCGWVEFRVWDTAGDPKFFGLKDAYWSSADGVIVFYTPETAQNSYQLEKEFQEECPNLPIIRVWNKIDLIENGNKKMRESLSNIDEKIGKMKIDFIISSKNKININKPFLQLAKTLTGYDHLLFENI